jgi:transcriptional regulator with XRE-family HTH domain
MDFGALLRRYRVGARLTEGLAERAGFSAYGIEKLERGTTRPYRDTAAQLPALELSAWKRMSSKRRSSECAGTAAATPSPGATSPWKPPS